MEETIEVIVARVEQRLIAVERDVREIKARRRGLPQLLEEIG